MPMSNQEIAELTWENGHLDMHGFGEILPCASIKSSTWDRTGDTLESVIHQATISRQKTSPTRADHINQVMDNVGPAVASYGSGWTADLNGLVKKRTRSDSDQCQRNFCSDDEWPDPTLCAGSGAAISGGNGKAMMTWVSYDSSMSTRTRNTDEDSACNGGSVQMSAREPQGSKSIKRQAQHVNLENHESGKTTSCETGRSNSARKGRAAAVHNLSERKRRDRINQKMRALQKLVPNASKTDKASMLDEVIDYLKQLQAQVQMMSTARSMPQHIFMPFGMHQQLQMPILARAGMGVGLGMGMGMLNASAPQHLASLMHPTTPMATSASTFVPPPLLVSPAVPSSASQLEKPDLRNTSLAPLLNSSNAILGQSMNMDMYNRMAALYRQQMNQSTKTSGHLQLNL